MLVVMQRKMLITSLKQNGIATLFEFNANIESPKTNFKDEANIGCKNTQASCVVDNFKSIIKH